MVIGAKFQLRKINGFWQVQGSVGRGLVSHTAEGLAEPPEATALPEAQGGVVASPPKSTGRTCERRSASRPPVPPP